MSFQKERIPILHFDGRQYQIRAESAVDDFRMALYAIYGKEPWHINEDAFPIEIFLPRGEIAKWRPKVGFVKNHVFAGVEVRFREYSAGAAEYHGQL